MTTLTQPTTGPSKRRPVNRLLALIIGCVCVAVIVDPLGIGGGHRCHFRGISAGVNICCCDIAGVFSLEKLFKFDLTEALAGAGRWQVPLAAALGALPGCGGAIIVVTRYVSGNLSFGSVLATLTATMGDAAFLLLAKEPVTGLFIIALGFSVGVVTGLFTDWVHGPGFMRPNKNENSAPIEHSLSEPDENSDLSSRFLDRLWMVLILPGIVMGVALAMQYELDELLTFGGIDSPATLWGFAGGMLCLMMWACRGCCLACQ